MDNNTGVTEEYKAMVEKVQNLEREKRGMYEEMKAEREKRQALESEVSSIRTEISAVRSSVPPVQDENLAWITEFAKNGRTIFKREFDELSKPLRETNDKLTTALAFREATDWVAEEEGVSPSKLKKSGVLADLDRISKDRNLLSLPPLPRAQAAYELLKNERRMKEDEERKRNEAIQANGTEPAANTPPAAGGKKVWKESEIASMPIESFMANQKDISLAKVEGRIVADLSGQRR